MPEMPPTGLPPAGFPGPASPQAPPWPPMAPVRRPLWPVWAMLVLTLIAVVAAVAAWLRPIPGSGSASAGAAASFSDQQVADAKASVCAAYEKIDRALRANVNRSGGDDLTAQLVVAVDIRQVYVSASAYLSMVLDEELATPPDLVAAVRKLSNLFLVITLDGLASDPSDAANGEADKILLTIAQLCR